MGLLADTRVPTGDIGSLTFFLQKGKKTASKFSFNNFWVKWRNPVKLFYVGLTSHEEEVKIFAQLLGVRSLLKTWESKKRPELGAI